MANQKKPVRKPAFLGPHDDRELELMLAGKKHLSYFFFEMGAEREMFPERQFDLHVASGFLVRRIPYLARTWRRNGLQRHIVRDRERGLANPRDANDSRYLVEREEP